MWTGLVLDGKYRVDEVIGTGGFGVVYRARDLQLGRTVALKVPRADRCDPLDLERFLDEARNLASLNHPNVVQVHALGEYEGQRFIDMEFIDGETLASVIRSGQLSIRRRLEIMRSVALGLEAMHRLGILHRDLTPNNIKVGPDGMTKIFDLGLSRNTRESRTGSMPAVKGTWGYFPPEMLEGKAVTPAGEVFSFGVILYELLCGENPFQAEHEAMVLYNLAHRAPEPIGTRVPGIPAALADLVERCLEKSPASRPQAMADVGRSLDGVIAQSGLDSAVLPASGRHRPSSSMSNPYLHRVMIRHRADFFGRRTEVQKIFSRLNADPPGSISVVGDRKVGKSSLLNHIYNTEVRASHLARPDQTVMVYVDLQVEKNPTVPAFVDMMLALVGHELRARVNVADCPRSLDGIRMMVERVNDAGIRLAVLLDEFEAITSNPNFGLDFFSFLRALASHYDVSYVTSSAQNLQVLCHTQEIKDSPFFNIFSTMRLTAFHRAEAEELVRVPSRRVGRPLEAHLETILGLSGLFPVYIQMACAHTLEVMDEAPAAPPDFGEVRRRFREEAEMHYRYLWDNLDPHERETLGRVASARAIPDSLRHVLDELHTRRYVVDDNPPRLFSSPFHDFVLAQNRQPGPASLMARLFGRRKETR